MCGIVGIVDFNGAPVSPAILKAMTDAIAHRGPDGEGQWIEGNIGLGHRRLAIIDPSPAGHQPMISADHRHVLVYNGEVYNFHELRSELEAAGYWFRSKTDTEVVLNALAHWGTHALDRFNGMFALALWDRKERTLLLARDRYGIKPLYVYATPDLLAFSSEQKSFLHIPEFKSVLDMEGLYEYFTFQNIFSDKTLLKNVYIVPAGHYEILKFRDGRLEKKRFQYWDYRFEEPARPRSTRSYREELEYLFRQAVNRQLVADVELGSYLSGGMDSGSITAMAAQSFPYLKTFTCGFDLSSASGIELAFDERARAEMMSYRFKTEHYEVVLKAGDMERVLPSLVWHLEEPRVGQSYPNYYVAGLASRFVKVVLSGAGGDELFAGYPWRYYRAVKSETFDEFINKYYSYWQRLLTSKELRQVFSPMWNEVSHVDTREIFSSVFSTHPRHVRGAVDCINLSLYFEAKTFLHGLFVVEDKISMAHSLETRVPFMDNDLVDFAMRCPVELKLNRLSEVVKVDENEIHEKGLFLRTSDGKQILRNMMRTLIPPEITEAEKQGFSAPDASWFRGDSIEFVKRKLLNPKARIYEILERSAVTDLVWEHLEGRCNRRLLIWSLLNLEEFLGAWKISA